MLNMMLLGDAWPKHFELEVKGQVCVDVCISSLCNSDLSCSLNVSVTLCQFEKPAFTKGVFFLKFVSRYDFFSPTAFRQTKQKISSHMIPKAGNLKLDISWQGSANPIKLGWVGGARDGPAGATAGRGGRTFSSLRLLSVVVFAVIVFFFTGGSFPKKKI